MTRKSWIVKLFKKGLSKHKISKHPKVDCSRQYVIKIIKQFQEDDHDCYADEHLLENIIE